MNTPTLLLLEGVRSQFSWWEEDASLLSESAVCNNVTSQKTSQRSFQAFHLSILPLFQHGTQPCYPNFYQHPFPLTGPHRELQHSSMFHLEVWKSELRVEVCPDSEGACRPLIRQIGPSSCGHPLPRHLTTLMRRANVVNGLTFVNFWFAGFLSSFAEMICFDPCDIEQLTSYWLLTTSDW